MGWDGGAEEGNTLEQLDHLHFVFFPSSQGMRMSGEAHDVLQLVGVERESAGTYACSALNTEGETRSSHLTLRVQCKWIYF